METALLDAVRELATRDDKWLQTPTNTEGVNTVYVNTFTGSDYYGDGTRLKPFQSLGRSWRVNSTKPTRIIVKGVSSENMADGNHNCTIEGDFYGAFIFDGGDNFVCYGFNMKNAIVLNGGYGRYDLSVYTGSEALAGCGRADGASYVGRADVVGGVAAPSVLIHNSGMYWSCIGGVSACSRVIYSHIKMSQYKIHLTTRNGAEVNSHNTIYGTRINERMRSIYGAAFGASIFANFDMFADDYSTQTMKYTGCLFAADCDWYYTDTTPELKVDNVSPTLKIIIDKSAPEGDVVFTHDAENGTMTIGGGMGDAKVVSIPTAIDAIVAAGRTAMTAAKKPTFKDCIFSTQTSDEIFTNAEKQDFTLKPDSDAILGEWSYIGALPPAYNVPIMHNSEGVPGTWNEKTANGIIEVSEDDDIVINAALASEGDKPSGSIQSKVVTIDTSRVSLSHCFALYESKFASLGLALWKDEIICAEFNEGDTLPVGTYKVNGAVVYNGQNIDHMGIVVVEESDEVKTFVNNGVESQLLMLADRNIADVLYVRTTPMAFAQVTPADELQPLGHYMNNGDQTITYNSRPIVPGESFVATYDVLHFVAPTQDYKVDVMFDDTRVPAVEWLPARMWGKYFECYESGVVLKSDVTGVPISSGNYESYFAPFLNIPRTILRKKYIQFKIEVRCIYDTINQ